VYDLGMHPNQASTPMQFDNQPMYHQQSDGLPRFMKNISFSGKHNGICLYLARILRYEEMLNLHGKIYSIYSYESPDF
jgi:hypothetical protein